MTDVWELERDRHSVMFSGPLEVGECIRVVRESDYEDARDEAMIDACDECSSRAEAIEAENERLREALAEAVATCGGGRVSYAPNAIYTPQIAVSRVEKWIAALNRERNR